VVILTGPPGAGKSTIARMLTEAHPEPAVHLPADEFWRYIVTGAVPPFLAAAHPQNEVIIDILADTAVRYALGGYFVVLDGIIGPWFLPPFIATARTNGVRLDYLVLRPSLPETLRRAQARMGQALRRSAPIRSLHHQFSDLGEFESHVLDTTTDSAPMTCTAVRNALRTALGTVSVD
jgi:predicted kinase